MAEVVRFKGGKKLEQYMAENVLVQKALDVHLHAAKARANFELRMHQFDDVAFVEVSRGKIDRALHLVDTRSGTPGAMTIEFGRKPGSNSDGGPSSGLYILHAALYASYKPKAGRVGKQGVRPNPTRRKAHYQ